MALTELSPDALRLQLTFWFFFSLPAHCLHVWLLTSLHLTAIVLVFPHSGFYILQMNVHMSSLLLVIYICLSLTTKLSTKQVVTTPAEFLAQSTDNILCICTNLCCKNSWLKKKKKKRKDFTVNISCFVLVTHAAL